MLNEYKLSYESMLNSNYKNMPDEVVVNNIDRDMNGVIIFNASGGKIAETIKVTGLPRKCPVISYKLKRVQYEMGK